MLVDDRDLPLT